MKNNKVHRYTWIRNKKEPFAEHLPPESGYYTILVNSHDRNKPPIELRAYFYGYPSMQWAYGDGTSKDILGWK